MTGDNYSKGSNGQGTGFGAYKYPKIKQYLTDVFSAWINYLYGIYEYILKR